MEENARLTELTRMLLSSSAFSGFMNELSIEQRPSQAPEQPTPQQAPLQPNTRKDVNPYQVIQQSGLPTQRPQQIGFALMPDIDFSNLDLNGGWNSSIDMTYNNAQVFAVTEVPQGPAVDTEILCGKASNFVPSLPTPDDSKDQVPIVERKPAAEKAEETAVASCTDVELDESDPAFALFVDSPAPKEFTPEPFEDMFGGVPLDKVFSRLELVVYDESADPDTVAMERFERICSSIDDAFQRISNLTAHL
jgi:ribonuclease Z